MQGHVGPFKYEKTVQNHPIRFLILKSTRLKFKNGVRRSSSGYLTLKSLKKEREEILERNLDSKDCLAVLPTGYGSDYRTKLRFHNRERRGESKKIIKLIALMKDQVERLSKIQNIRAIYRGNMAYNW